MSDQPKLPPAPPVIPPPSLPPPPPPLFPPPNLRPPLTKAHDGSRWRTQSNRVVAPPQVSDSERNHVAHLDAEEYQRTPRGNQVVGQDPADQSMDLDEEHIEELFGQLWAIPNQEKPRVPISPHDGCLFWVRGELVRERCIRPEDYFPVSGSQRINGVPMTLRWSDIRPGDGKRATYADVLRRIPMADGGRWVWQPDRPPHAQRGRPQRGRGCRIKVPDRSVHHPSLHWQGRRNRKVLR
jgi:hypothetical protein